MTQGITPYPFPRPSFEFPVTPPDAEAGDSPLTTVCFSSAWLPFVEGALKQLLLQSTWAGTDDEITTALGRATDLLGLFMALVPTCPEMTVLTGIRYNAETDTIQTDFGGTGDWVDQPTFDPRHSDVFRFPPHTTSDTRCDAAHGMVVAFKTFIQAGQRYTEIAQITDAIIGFLLLFIPEIGLFLEIIIAAAEALFTAGVDALTDNFTDTVYSQIQCAFYCHIGSDGTVTGAQKEAIRAQVQAEQNTFVYDLFLAFLLLTGEVGLQNAGAINTETGDCSACTDCAYCVSYSHDDGWGDWEIRGGNAIFDGTEWKSVVSGANTVCSIKLVLGTAVNIDSVEVTFNAGSVRGGAFRGVYFDDAATIPSDAATNLPTFAGVNTGTVTYTVTSAYIGMDVDSGGTDGDNYITKIVVRGTGAPPTGGTAC